ncbi:MULTISPECIES: hypothetical protein [unclassified Streptomyces]
MPLRKDMPTRDPKRVPDADRHATDYQSPRGGWLKSSKPSPDTSKKS